MTVASILKQKGGEVVTAPATATTAQIAALLQRHRIGAVLVMGPEGAIEGIVSERDIVSAIARSGAPALERPAGEIMTKDVHVCDPADGIYERCRSRSGTPDGPATRPRWPRRPRVP
jgi:CBS domain-containing protein